MVHVAALVGLAVLLAWPAPRLMARRTGFRRAPRAALVVWQCVSLAAVLAALAAGPAIVPQTSSLTAGRGPVLVVAATVSVGMLARLLYAGHRVGTRLRAVRRRHRELVDLLGLPQGSAAVTGRLPAGSLPTGRLHDGHVRVLEHPTPTAYCLPGLRRRVVLTQGTLEALPPDELGAVLAHERAHLRARHDLILEFFTVLHTAVPGFLRSEAALSEVRLLVEVLADRAATRVTGIRPLARALVALAGGSHPDAALAASDGTALARLELLAEAQRPHRALAALMYAFAVAALAAPVLLTAAAFT
jgi:Zn-dependent protease with chaperone function